jgi:hypothetical protein
MPNTIALPAPPKRSAVERALAFLQMTRNGDAGWPYLPQGDSAAEPTSYATLAISRGKSECTDFRAIEWIVTHADGKGTAQPLWSKALSLLALGRLRVKPEVRNRLIESLLSAEVKQISSQRSINDLNGALRGWSWVDGTFSWVEPTSYALLALKINGSRTHPRIHEAERLLMDRMCEDGGWNYGNRKVRGIALTSLMPTTALAAMALQGAAGNSLSLQRALDLLDREVSSRPSSLSLALAILCFDVYQRPCGRLMDRLLARQDPDGSWRGQTHLTALAVLALQTKDQSNVFEL